MSMSGLSVVFSVFVLNIHHRGVLAKGPPKVVKTCARFAAKMLCMTVYLDNQINYGLTPNYTSERNYMYPSHESEALIQHDLGRHAHANMNHVDINDVSNETLTDVMNQNVNMSNTNMYKHEKSTFDKELLTYFKQVMLIHDNSLCERQAVHEWQEVARVVDRVSFCVFLAITGLSTIFLLIVSPMTKDINLDNLDHI